MIAVLFSLCWSGGNVRRRGHGSRAISRVVIACVANHVSRSYIWSMVIRRASFTAAQVMEITGVPYQTLNHWVKIGLVRSSIAPAQGSGSRRVYDFQDLASIFVATKLRRAGMHGKAIVRIMELLRKAGFDSPSQVAVDVMSDGEVIVSSPAGERMSARKYPAQLLLNWDCRGAMAQLRKRVQEPKSKSIDKSIRKRVSSERKSVWSSQQRRRA